jgi:hypothetical protein
LAGNYLRAEIAEVDDQRKLINLCRYRTSIATSPGAESVKSEPYRPSPALAEPRWKTVWSSLALADHFAVKR